MSLLRLKVEIKNVIEEANAKADNALVMHNFGDPINTNGVDDFDFFWDPDGQIGHISGGGEISQNMNVFMNIF